MPLACQQPGLSLQTDLVFKAVFGRDTSESKELLIDLLNTILHNKEAMPRYLRSKYCFRAGCMGE